MKGLIMEDTIKAVQTALTDAGVTGIDETTKMADLPKILKQNKKVLQAHDDLAAAKSEVPAEDDPEVEEVTPEGEKPEETETSETPEEETKETETPAPKAEVKDVKPATTSEKPAVPTSTAAATAAPKSDTKRKFGTAFPDR